MGVLETGIQLDSSPGSDPIECREINFPTATVEYLLCLSHLGPYSALKHCRLWQASGPRAPPDVEDLVLELDAAFADSSLEFLDQADEPQELTYVDIDTFLESF